MLVVILISIHAPRTGSDFCCFLFRSFCSQFQSTLPARGATVINSLLISDSRISIHAPRTGSDTDKASINSRLTISIHAPRTGSDRCIRRLCSKCCYFNPRSPHGERRLTQATLTRTDGFQSTLPARGATDSVTRSQLIFANFNPRSPHGERPGKSRPSKIVLSFQSTLPARGATLSSARRVVSTSFQSTLPARGATEIKRRDCF